MIGLIVTSHGPLANALVESSKLFSGEMENIAAVVLLESDSPENFRNQLDEAVKQVDQQEGVLILVDIPGGTPSNQSLMLSNERLDVEVVSGVNLMMMIEVLISRNNCDSVLQLARSAQEVGSKSVLHLSEQMRSSNNDQEGDGLDSL